MIDTVAAIQQAQVVALDFETADFAPYGYETKLIGSEARPLAAGVGWIDPVTHKIEGDMWTFDIACDHGHNLVTWRWFADQILRPMWVSKQVKVFHNAKFDVQIGIQGLFQPKAVEDIVNCMPQGVIHDTLIMSHLLNESTPHDLKYLARTRLGKKRLTYTQTEAQQAQILRQGTNAVRCELGLAWESYVQQKRMPADNSLPWHLRKDAFMSLLESQIKETIMNSYVAKADKVFATYTTNDPTDTLGVYQIMLPQLESQKKLWRWYEKVELPFSLLLVEWEFGGMPVDVEFLGCLESNVRALITLKRNKLVQEIKDKYQMDLNPGSGDQVKELLWNQLHLEAPEWAPITKKHNLPATNAKVMKFLAQKGHDVCKALSDLNALRTLHSTFLEPICTKATAHPEHLCRYSFLSLGAVTGRMSATPNSQNFPNANKMPIVSEEEIHDIYRFLDLPWDKDVPIGWKLLDENGAKHFQMLPIRKAFIPRPGYKLVIADYSQIELRMIAELSQDANLLRAYCSWQCECGQSGWATVAMHSCPSCGALDGKRDITKKEQPVLYGFCLGMDLHSLTAFDTGLMSRYPVDEARTIAKKVNFGYCYGMWYTALVRDLGLAPKEAEELYYAYFRAYPKVKILLDYLLLDQLRKTGRFNYVLGRERRFLEERDLLLKKKLPKSKLRATIREIANNIPQGSAMNFVKLGLLRYYHRKRQIPALRHSYVCNAVHDEAVVQVKEDAALLCKNELIPALEGAGKISVPILVDCKICSNYAEGKK